jgi:hypothetical protein
MKKIIVVLVVMATLFSCSEKDKKAEKTVGKAEGRWNSLMVVMPNESWKGILGDSIRAVFAQQVEGIPGTEPRYTLTQVAKELFSGYLVKQRNVLIVNIDDTNKKPFLYKENVFAKPQQVFQLSGDRETIFQNLKLHEKEMLDTFYKKELVAFNADQNSKIDKKKQEALTKIGLKMRVPYAFRLAENKGDFFWFMKDIKNGYSNLIVYDFPMSEVPFDSIPNYILKKRDIIGSKYIPGELKDSYVISETQFSPNVYQIDFKGNRAVVSKGLWRMSNEFKGGPYLSYVIEDKLNQRYLVLEGFVYAPNVAKRNFLFELDATIQTAELIEMQQ